MRVTLLMCRSIGSFKILPPPLPHPHLPGFQTKTLKTFSSEPFARQSELFAFKHHHIEI